MMQARRTRWAMGVWVAVVAGFLASLCCVGPLILVVAGVGGAWVSHLTVLDPIRPWLTAATLIVLSLAHVRYWRSRRVTACDCKTPTDWSALWLWLGTAFVLVALAAPYVLPILILPSLPHVS
ncbi:MAG TPA: mercuric transporter MerT family protein [Acidiferrobacter sp.]|nr:mercuric transporter MerT family protein [Acidiferrobacter sp.]